MDGYPSMVSYGSQLLTAGVGRLVSLWVVVERGGMNGGMDRGWKDVEVGERR